MTTQGSIRFDNLSDEDLLTVVKRLALAERNATAQLVRCLGEIDARRLYLSQGCPSLFVYCTRVLQLSEHAAYGRIKAARAARTVPLVLSLLEDGAITLTTVTLLAAHLTPENCVATLGEARNKNKRQVEELVARLRPAPDVPAVLRKLPQPAPLAKAEAFPPIAPPTSSTPAAVACQGEVPAPIPEPVSTRPPATVKPLSPERYKLQVTLTRDGQEKLLRVRDLMRHSVPNGDLSEIVERAIASLLKELERTSTRPPTVPANPHKVRGRKAAARFRRRFAAPSGSGMAHAALSSGARDVAVKAGFSNSTMSFPLQPAERRRWRTSSCDAGRTTPMKRSSGF